MGIPNPVAAIGGLVLVLYTYRKKRIKLNAHAALVLDEIRNVHTNGVANVELVSKFNSQDYPDMNLHEVIGELVNARRTDGVKAPLIEEVDGRLYALDV